ncbi:MAG: peptidoglycan DD-metalloendopeptidase family protein [Limnochordia bacterium]|nr:peptidoglycan DD-metalloendopeptidase family protein [Limnochordia bacterium]
MSLRRKQLFRITGLLLLLVVATGTTYGFENRVLEQGMKGSDVMELQRRLAELGYAVEPDGVFGAQTKNAVKIFQADFNLKADGIAGPKTFAVLGEVRGYVEYVVRPGDTLWDLAREFQTTVQAIKERNRLKSDILRIGQILRIDRSYAGGDVSDRVYVVAKGDSLYSIAKQYNTTIEALATANSIANPRTLPVGKTLIIPGSGSDASVRRMQMSWPVTGRISSPFGPRIHPLKNVDDFHNGIDIAVPTGTKVRAAAGGVVTWSGWMGGFGYTVVIDHGDGIETLYAHNSKLQVKVGARINRGDVVALSGNTGTSTGPHLHFSIKIDGDYVDPTNWLIN